MSMVYTLFFMSSLMTVPPRLFRMCGFSSSSTIFLHKKRQNLSAHTETTRSVPPACDRWSLHAWWLPSRHLHDCRAKFVVVTPLPLSPHTPTWRVSGNSDLARALANWLKNTLVSSDQRPPTSTARTTSSAGRAGQFWVDSGFLARGHLQCDAIVLRSTESRAAVCEQGTDQRRVHCKLGSSLQRQVIHNHFKSSPIRNRHIQVHAPHQHVGADSSSCLPTYPGGHTLQGEATSAQHSRPRTSCTMMATTSGRPHRQLRTDRERACRRRRKRITRKRWGGIVVSRLVGATVSAAPAPGPDWERTSACTCSGILVHKSSRYRSSTLALASCCQPDRTAPGSKWLGSRSAGRVSAAAASWRRATSAA